MSTYYKIKEFSDKLEKVLEIDINICQKEYKEIQWHTPNFVIDTTNRFLEKEWHYLLEVAPRYNRAEKIISTWDLTEHLSHGGDFSLWKYKFKGTCTENLPSPMYQQLILDEIKNVTVKTYWIDKNGLKNL